jgi:beta-lactamase regulating signal transducer with metallopeptidase domain
MIFERWAHLLAAALVVTLVRGLALFVVAYALTALCRRLSSETRHLLWLGVIAAFPLIPLAWLLAPAVRLNTWIRVRPADSYRLAAAAILARAEYVQLIERAREQAAMAAQPQVRQLPAILPALVVAWVTGMFFLVGRLLFGSTRLRRLVAAAGADERLQAQADKLSRQMASRRSIRLRLSPSCRIPFACGIRQPTILLPKNAKRWPANRLRASLAHELAHIRRRDLLAQSIGYDICVLFWFFPPLWLAYAALMREAETCCDQQVINRGFRGPEYARDIVDLARSCEGRILLPSVSSVIGRESMLKERIRKVLSLEPGRPQSAVRRALQAAAICLACVAPILALTAQARPLLLHPSDPLFGTWANSAYDSAAVEISAKMVLSADGGEIDYRKTMDAQPYAEGKLTLEVAWVDAEGNHWYKLLWVGDYHPLPLKEPRFSAYVLTKVNAAGDVLETISHTYAYPKDLDDVTKDSSAHLEYRRL